LINVAFQVSGLEVQDLLRRGSISKAMTDFLAAAWKLESAF